MSKAKNWAFTLNNWTPEEFDGISQGLQEAVYGIVGKEVGEQGTPHLQGYVSFRAAIRMTTVKTRLQTQRLHLEVCRGTPEQNRAYCQKEGEYQEWGSLPAGQGTRNDLAEFFEWAQTESSALGRPVTTPEAALSHPTIVTKYPRALAVARLRFDPPVLETGTPKIWQQDLWDECSQDANNRQVVFYVDSEGGKGKSWFVRWMVSKRPHDVQMLSVGKRDDLAYCVRTNTKVFLIDIPRASMTFLQYPFLEMLKNQIVFSPKYQSEQKILRSVPHVIVFCNECPDMNAMTNDRYVIRNL